MNSARTRIVLPVLTAVAFAGLGGAAMGANLVANGSFSESGYTVNNEFDPTYGGQLVTNWTSTGYAIYFFNGTQTTTSANNEWGSTLEKLWKSPTTADPDGGNFVALDADPTIASTLSQTITGLTADTWYTVTFDWAAGQLQSRTGPTTEAVQVSLGSNSATTSTVSTPSEGANGWYTQTFNLFATSSTETLQFLAIGTPAGDPPMVLLDGVSMQKAAVPEPGTLTLLGAGAALMFGVRRRRKAARR